MSKKRYRILYIQKTSEGGSVISLYELLRDLNTEIFEPVVLFFIPNRYHRQFKAIGVKVFTLFEKPPKIKTRISQRDIAKSLRSIRDWLSEVYLNAKQIYLMVFKEWPVSRQIAKLIKDEKIDFVHHNYSLHNNLDAVIAARMAGVLQICHVRKFDKLSLLDRCVARFVRFFIYISKAVEECYRRQGIPAQKGEVIYNPFDGKPFGDNCRDTKVLAELGLSDKDRLVTNVGRLDWWKGHDYFLQAIAEVIKSEPNVKALIVGSADHTIQCQNYYRKLKKLVFELRLSNHVIFTGFRSDIPQILSVSDVMVHSASEPEPFGRVVVEGMLAERPVIATAAGGVTEIIEDQVTGLLVPLKDAKSMAGAIRCLLQNPVQAKRIGRCARERVISRFFI